MVAMRPSRVATIAVSETLLIAAIGGLTSFCWLDSNLPKDAVLLRIEPADSFGMYKLWVWSSEFDEVPEAAIPPMFGLTWTAHRMMHAPEEP